MMLNEMDGSVVDLIKRNAESYRLGSQGADLLYFRPTQFLRGRRGVVYHAKMLHSQPVDKLAAMSLKYLMNLSGKRQLESTFAYICGFINHHAVDQKVHPFIDMRNATMLRHRRIELDFDAYICRAMDARPGKGSHRLADLSGIMSFVDLAHWYNHMFRGLYGKDFSLRSYIRDYKAMRRASGLLDKPRRLTKLKHTDRPLLTEGELRAMLSAALEGTRKAAGLVNGLYWSLEPRLTAVLIPAAEPEPQWAGT